jgi:hypothetical protein
VNESATAGDVPAAATGGASAASTQQAAALQRPTFVKDVTVRCSFCGLAHALSKCRLQAKGDSRTLFLNCACVRINDNWQTFANFCELPQTSVPIGKPLHTYANFCKPGWRLFAYRRDFRLAIHAAYVICVLTQPPARRITAPCPTVISSE